MAATRLRMEPAPTLSSMTSSGPGGQNGDEPLGSASLYQATPHTDRRPSVFSSVPIEPTHPRQDTRKAVGLMGGQTRAAAPSLCSPFDGQLRPDAQHWEGCSS